MKFLICILFIFIIAASCSKVLSPTDLKLQGNWKLARDPITDEEFNVFKEIIFEQDKFEMNFLYVVDAGGGSGEFNVSGTYKSDRDSLYLNGIYTKAEYYFKEKDGLYKRYKNTVREYGRNFRYEIRDDTLIIFSGGQQHYLTKDPAK